MNKNNVDFDMRNHHVTYGQLDKLLLQLGFVRHAGAPKWVWYEHAASGTEIILAQKKFNETARPSEVVAARVHLVAKGLMSEEEIGNYLGNEAGGKRVETTRKKKK